jgi:alkanesulfonate monooxygenase SsuD/methylene tetrahydromethanopterin reductase-like flavin-dependent oxidoreductase (luciferase family)
VTTTLRFGTAVMLLPQHDPDRLAATAAAVAEASGDRLEVGVGLGHRDAEFDGLGIPRSRRGTRMAAGLDRLRFPPQRVWVGGMAEVALDRLGARGMSALLPQTLDAAGITGAIGRIDLAASGAAVPRGRIGVLRDVWVDADGDRAREWFLPRLRRHYVEEIGAWWVLGGGGHGFADPARLNRQVARTAGAAVVGTPDEVAAALLDVAALGVDTVVVRLNFDFTYGQALDRALELFAGTVLPLLKEAP